LFLLFATGINSRGEIVGFGLTSTFDAHAFWRPRATAKTTANRANSEISIPWTAAPIVLLEYSAQPASSGLSYGWKCSTLAKPASTCRGSVATLVSKALAGCGIDTAACRAAFAFSSG
jgi:hypothetical protein